MVTLERFLRADRRQPAPPDAWAGVLEHVLSRPADLLLAEVTEEPLRRDLAALRQSVAKAETAQELAEADQAHQSWTEAVSAARQKLEDDRKRDFQNIFSLLNEALSLAGGGSERSVNRLERLEGALATVAQANDLREVKRQLTQVIQNVREEAASERQRAEAARKSLEPRLAEAREVASRFRTGMATRKEAVAEWQTFAAPSSWALVLAAPQLRVVAERYGDPVVAEFLEAAVTARFSAIGTAEPRVYRFSPESLLLILTHAGDAAEVSRAVSSETSIVFEHRVNLGLRQALIQVAFRWVVLPTEEGSAAAFDASVERFVQGAR